jgi:hypothetical protein
LVLHLVVRLVLRLLQGVLLRLVLCLGLGVVQGVCLVGRDGRLHLLLLVRGELALQSMQPALLQLRQVIGLIRLPLWPRGRAHRLGLALLQGSKLLAGRQTYEVATRLQTRAPGPRLNVVVGLTK